MPLTADPEGSQIQPHLGHISFLETNHEIISTAIFLFPLIEEGQSSVTDESIYRCTHHKNMPI